MNTCRCCKVTEISQLNIFTNSHWLRHIHAESFKLNVAMVWFNAGMQATVRGKSSLHHRWSIKLNWNILLSTQGSIHELLIFLLREALLAGHTRKTVKWRKYSKLCEQTSWIIWGELFTQSTSHRAVAFLASMRDFAMSAQQGQLIFFEKKNCFNNALASKLLVCVMNTTLSENSWTTICWRRH